MLYSVERKAILSCVKDKTLIIRNSNFFHDSSEVGIKCKKRFLMGRKRQLTT